MRILFTMTGGWGTGSGTVVEALVRGLAARGHQTCVAYPITRGAPEAPGEHAPEAEHAVWPFPLERDGVALYTYPLMIPDPNPENFDGAWTAAALTDAQLDLYLTGFGEHLRATVERFQPDVIECQHVWAMPAAAEALGLPYFVASHHSDQMAFEQDARMRPVATRAALGARLVFALNESNAAEVRDLYGVPHERIVVMGNGYDRDVFLPVEVDRAALLARFGLDVPAETPLVTFAGKLSRTKGVDVLLEANRLLRERMAVPPHFVLFGGGDLDTVLDPSRPEAYALDGVHLLGHHTYEVVRDFHAVARVSVMPSRSEGFGLAALEAMGCGLPVVVTRLGGPDAYSVGPVVEPEDALGLADAIQSTLAMPEAEYAALRQRALDVAGTFSWDALVERRLVLYEEALRA